jgi:GT2 family glycosyltransferase
LCKNEFNEDIGWIAPKIYSEKEGRDRNPKITNRLSLAKMNLLRILYKYPSLFRLHKKTFHKRKRKEYPEHTELEIYAGHGSFIILTRNFLKKQIRFNYPVFLFGEEIFFGELMKNADLKVLYLPKLKLYDIDHVSTSQFDDKWYCKENFKAVSFLIEKFYE